MTFSVTYILGSRHMGVSPVHLAYRPHSLAYCCPTCGEVWARAVVTSDDILDPKSYWEFQPVACIRHTPQGVMEWGRIPGSFLLNGLGQSAEHVSIMHRARCIDTFPRQVLLHELELIFNELDKELA